MVKLISRIALVLSLTMVLASCAAAEVPGSNDEARADWPKVGECMQQEQANFSKEDAGSVPCVQGEYTGLTLGVFEVDPNIDFELSAVLELDSIDKGSWSDSQLALFKSYTDFYGNADLECRSLLNEQLGAIGAYRGSLFYTVVTVPSAQKWSERERWLRCTAYSVQANAVSGKTVSFGSFPSEFKEDPLDYKKQLCAIFEELPIVGSCSDPDFAGGAWLKLDEEIPIRQAGDFPGTADGVEKLILQTCIDYSRGSISEISPKDYYAEIVWVYGDFVNLSLENFDSDLWSQYWQNPALGFNCWVPNWAYKQGS